MIHVELATAETLGRSGADVLGRSVRAVVAVEDDGSIVGVAGIYADGYRQVMFANLTEAITQNKRQFIKAMRMLMKIAARCKAPVHAEADPTIPHSRVLLEHMGFRPLTGDLYVR